MLQRIQTLYLLSVVGVMALTLHFPLATFVCGAESYLLEAFGLKNATGLTVQPTLYLGIVLAVSSLLPVVIIFCYKHRQLQIRLCAAEMVLLVGSLVMSGIYYFLCARVFSDFSFHAQSFKIPIVFPLISLIFTFMAMRAIFRDELLVRSVNRIR
ncbi:MAG: DUF4293 domain-containing protein [Alistipes sp.]